ncbi:hypothetical protein MTO96_029591 [Rhipicephalus appendiculatus]
MWGAPDRDQRCRSCGYQRETLYRVLCHCMARSAMCTARHNAIAAHLRKAATRDYTIAFENRPVGETGHRPDLVHGEEAIIIDRVTVAAVVVGALGAWDPDNDRVLQRICSPILPPPLQEGLRQRRGGGVPPRLPRTRPRRPSLVHGAPTARPPPVPGFSVPGYVPTLRQPLARTPSRRATARRSTNSPVCEHPHPSLCTTHEHKTGLIYKTKDPAVPSNWRPIALGSATSKLYAKCLVAHLQPSVMEHHVLPHCQKGFLPYEGVLKLAYVFQHRLDAARSWWR